VANLDHEFTRQVNAAADYERRSSQDKAVANRFAWLQVALLARQNACIRRSFSRAMLSRNIHGMPFNRKFRFKIVISAAGGGALSAIAFGGKLASPGGRFAPTIVGMEFRVELEVFRGPLDLLLFLVRKHELDVRELPVSLVAEQYVAYLEILQELHIDAVGEFLEIASTLIEIKSEMVLPHGEQPAAEWEEKREELVERLLEYKRYKDAASTLDERSRDWQQHYPRLASDLLPRAIDPAGQPIREVELWDLVSAMGRILRDSQVAAPSTIVYDDTPIQVYMQRLHAALAREGRLALSDMFASGMHKSAIIGVFLAVLELVRHHGVVAEQSDSHGEIWLVKGDAFDAAAEIAGEEPGEEEGNGPVEALSEGDNVPGD
jgi:segregation and condensation protein A